MAAEASISVTPEATAVHGGALGAKGAPTVFCGLTVEYSNLDNVFQQLGMTREEVEGAMAPSARWPLPGHLEGACRGGKRALHTKGASLLSRVNAPTSSCPTARTPICICITLQLTGVLAPNLATFMCPKSVPVMSQVASCYRV